MAFSTILVRHATIFEISIPGRTKTLAAYNNLRRTAISDLQRLAPRSNRIQVSLVRRFWHALSDTAGGRMRVYRGHRMQ